MKTLNNARLFMLLAAVSGFLAVFAGAFGAHIIEQMVGSERLGVWNTAVRYQFYHTLVLFMAGWISRQSGSRWIVRSGWCFVAGTVVFSGSLYLLVLLDFSMLGMVTPLGGLLLLAGWVLLAVGIWSQSEND